MKRLLVILSIALTALTSCNLDSDMGIFEQIYKETENSSITVRRMVGEYNGEYYFVKKENGLAKASPESSDYNTVGSIPSLNVLFVTSDGKAVCSTDDAYRIISLSDGTSSSIVFKSGATQLKIQGVYYNSMPGTEARGKFTIIFMDNEGEYYIYNGNLDFSSIVLSTDPVEYEFSSSVSKINTPEGNAPQIIGPGAYIFYNGDEDQSRWVIKTINSSDSTDSPTFSDRPILYIDGLVVCNNGYLYFNENYKQDIGGYTEYAGSRVVAAGVKDGIIYGITDECSFSYNTNTVDSNLKVTSNSTSHVDLGLMDVSTTDTVKIRVATTKNGIKNLNI